MPSMHLQLYVTFHSLPLQHLIFMLSYLTIYCMRKHNTDMYVSGHIHVCVKSHMCADK